MNSKVELKLRTPETLVRRYQHVHARFSYLNDLAASVPPFELRSRTSPLSDEHHIFSEGNRRTNENGH